MLNKHIVRKPIQHTENTPFLISLSIIIWAYSGTALLEMFKIDRTLTGQDSMLNFSSKSRSFVVANEERARRSNPFSFASCLCFWLVFGALVCSFALPLRDGVELAGGGRELLFALGGEVFFFGIFRNTSLFVYAKMFAYINNFDCLMERNQETSKKW